MRNEDLKPGLAVIVAFGETENVPVYHFARVLRSTEEDSWWLSVSIGGASADVPHQFRASEILGVPATNLRPESHFALRELERRNIAGERFTW